MTHRCKRRGALAVFVALVTSACSSESLNAGSTRLHGLLPVDERSPLIVANDGASDNWQGEYAVLLANGGGPRLAGIIVNDSGPWPDLTTNVVNWRGLIAAARASGLAHLPDPTASIGSQLARPDSGQIEDTVANRSEGARLIVSQAAKLSLPYRPLVVATGGRLTDVADAYLIDHSVKDKIVVVSSMGTVTSSGGSMGAPNGEMDPWADVIVTTRLHFVQVSAYYDQLTDVPESRVAELPDNPLGAWMAAKQSGIWQTPVAADQVAILAVAVPEFVSKVAKVSPRDPGSGAGAGPELGLDPAGSALLVTESAGALATARLWELLLDPKTFGR